jgi:hypothetical protein
MLRTLIVLGPLVLAAMLAHPIMVSAQRVDMLQARPRELSRLPPRPPLTHTLERRRHPTKEQVAESQSAREARIAVAQREREAGLSETLNEDLAALSRPREPPLSFRQWCETSNRVIETLQQLVTGGRTAERTRLLNLRVTFLENYLEFLIRGNELDHHITEQDIRGAVNRARAVHDMDGTQSAQWEHVVRIIGDLRTGSSLENGQNTFKLLTRAVGLINYVWDCSGRLRGAAGRFLVSAMGPPQQKGD